MPRKKPDGAAGSNGALPSSRVPAMAGQCPESSMDGTRLEGGSGGTVLVTGGAGYIGSHACKALKKAGYLPVVFDNLVYGHEEDVRWGPFVKGDITDRSAIDKVLHEQKPIGVVHFAGYAYVGESVTNPGKYYRNNIVGSLTLLEAMRDNQVKNLVFSSTCAVYGIPVQVPIPENHSFDPINPYGFSKLAMERMMADFAHAHELRFAALRYFNAAGADPESEVGERHDPETHLIPLVLDAVLGKRPHITVFGNDYPTYDGTCIRDYIHVQDLANAHVLTLEYLFGGGKERCFNLGTGQGFSVKEVIACVEKVTGRKVPVVYGERRAGDPPSLVADSRKAAKILGWVPEFHKIEAIVEHAWKHRLTVNGPGKK